MAKKKSKMEDAPDHLPGLAPKRHAELHKAGERYKEAKEAAGTARGKAKDAEAKCIEIMERDKIPVYCFGDLKLKLTEKKSVNVREIDETDSEGGDLSEDQGKEFADNLNE